MLLDYSIIRNSLCRLYLVDLLDYFVKLPDPIMDFMLSVKRLAMLPYFFTQYLFVDLREIIIKHLASFNSFVKVFMDLKTKMDFLFILIIKNILTF